MLSALLSVSFCAGRADFLAMLVGSGVLFDTETLRNKERKKSRISKRKDEKNRETEGGSKAFVPSLRYYPPLYL